MDKPEGDRATSSEDSSLLTRNRSFKSKQLVRSQAIRESTSPPRSTTPPHVDEEQITIDNVTVNVVDPVNVVDNATSDASSHESDDRCSVNSCNDKIDPDDKRQRVEIQITPGAWDAEPQSEQRLRTKRWLVNKQHSSRDLLSNNPRVACVCGACTACPHCRGRRRKDACPIKQDSGIVCSDECPDCSDSENGGSSVDCPRKPASDRGSLDGEEQAFYCRCPEKKEKPKNISLSRTDSDDKSEPTGPELVEFIKHTLNKNPRDRMTLLKIEKELHLLVNDTGRCIVRFPVMTSYGRMLVHRCAALFQLSHHLDQTNKTSVLVSKSGTSGGRIPCTAFKAWCTTTFPATPSAMRHHHVDNTHAKSILKRDTHSLEEVGGGALTAARSKSLEQREREYERVRRRIFSTDNCTQDESQWPWLSSGPVKLLTPDTGRNKLLKVQSLESGSGGSVGPWRARGAVAKSHSFGGYGQPHPQHQHQPHQPRLLSKQGDLASSSWRLSPSSSGYRTLSLHSTDSVTPSPTGGASPEPAGGGAGLTGGGVMWAVTDLSAVPAGALVIHPQTGRPLTNADGSVYHFDPAHPPLLYDTGLYTQTDQLEQACEKRRGRLEKQHSFIDNECDCPPSEECRNKCRCECRRHETCNQPCSKTPNQSEQKTNTKPASPCKTRYEQNIESSTNHSTPQELHTNHRSSYDHQTNQKPPLDTSANQRPYEANHNYSTPNQRPYYEREQRVFENQRPQSYETNQKVNETPPSNHRTPKLTNQDSQDMQYIAQQSYTQGFRHDEVTSPQGANHTFIQPDLAMQIMAQAKITPVPMSDPNLRPLSLGNIVYPTQVPQGYSYVNQCRMEQPLQAVYQPVVHTEEKQLAPSTHAESTFRIDPSYPYAPVDYTGQCGACTGGCVDPTLQHQHRSVNVSYGQMDVPPAVLPQGYPVSNMILPQPQLQPYAYQDQLQWQNLQQMVPLAGAPAPKLFVHELYPIVQYPNMYPQYNVVYPTQHPQMVPQSYPVCPVYPVAEKQPERRASFAAARDRNSKRNSVSGSSRNTPLQTPTDEKKVPYDDTPAPAVENAASNPQLSRQNSNEIAAKIQQIKEQMAQMNTRESEKPRKEEWRRRNSGNGILGSYPPAAFNGRVVARPPNDETQLSTAARAIVNSIRSMQAKTTYHQERRPDYHHYRSDKPEYSYQRRRDPERERQRDAAEEDQRIDGRRGVVPFQYRPPYLFRQMSPGTWCRRSPGPIHPVLNPPRRPHPDTRNGRR